LSFDNLHQCHVLGALRLRKILGGGFSHVPIDDISINLVWIAEGS